MDEMVKEQLARKLPEYIRGASHTPKGRLQERVGGSVCMCLWMGGERGGGGCMCERERICVCVCMGMYEFVCVCT